MKLNSVTAYTLYSNDKSTDQQPYVLHAVVAHVDGVLSKYITSATDPMHAIDKAYQSNQNEWEKI